MDGNSGTGTPPRPPVPDVLLDGLRTLVNKGSNVQTTTPLVSGTLFARLKALNRAATASVQAHKALAAEARVEMDQTQLGLQNLQYEKRHLEREIEKCRQFASMYQDIPLYPLEEYVTSAPPDLRTEDIMSDEHQLMLSRLNFELSERQKLEAQMKEFTKQKEDMLKQSKTQQTTADAVKASIDSLMKTATDIQKKVDELVPAPPASSPPPDTVDDAVAPSESVEAVDDQMES